MVICFSLSDFGIIFCEVGDSGQYRQAKVLDVLNAQVTEKTHDERHVGEGSSASLIGQGRCSQHHTNDH